MKKRSGAVHNTPGVDGNRHWHHVGIVAALIAAALGLRLWGISFGLPHVYHYDEHFYINTALNLGAGVLHNPPYAATGLPNMLFPQYAGYYAVSRVLGSVTSAAEFEGLYRTDPTVFYLLARGTVAVFGAATIAAVYKVGKAGAGTTTGLIAAGFLACSFIHVRDSHYAVPDAAVPFFVTLAVALAAYTVHTGKRRPAYLASLVGGLAVAMKWTALPVALPVLWASVRSGTGQRQSRVPQWFSRGALLSVLLLALGFSLGSPQILVNPWPYVNEALGQYGAGQTGGYEIWQVDTLPGWWFYVRILSYGLGAVLLALAALGCLRRLIMAVQDDTGMSVVLLSFPMVYFGLMGSTRHYFARYALPLVPFSALFAAEAVVASGRWVHARHQSLGWVLITGLAIVAVAQPFASTVRHDALLTRTDTRTLARHWIESNIPAGSRIAVDWRTHGPPLATGETGRPESDTIFDVTAVGGSGLSDHALDWYREQAFDYLIATSFIYEIPLVDEEQDQQRRAFYTSLDRELQLMYEIRPSRDGTEPPFVFDEIYGPIVGLSQRQRPGPTLKIYRVDGS